MKNIFIMYARKDESFLHQLVKHLAFMEQSDLVQIWHDGLIPAGSIWEQEINENLARSDIIILLVSSHFFASEYGMRIELAHALSRYQKGEVVLLPIIVRDCLWDRTDIARFQVLPRDAMPINKWVDVDEAWAAVVKEIERIVRARVPATPRAVLLKAEGSVRDFDDSTRFRMEEELRKVTGDPSLRIVNVRSGSVILELEMSDEAASMLMHLVESGELKTLVGHKVRSATLGGRVVHSRDTEMKNIPFRAIKLLFLAANPIETERLLLDQEGRMISQHLRACRLGHQIQLISRWAVQPDDILFAMNEDRPDIIHFSGHGSESGELRFVDSGGSSAPLDVATLRRVFGVFRDMVRLVVLNACFSSKQAKAISQLLDCTIGMSREIPDQAARLYSASFCRGIGYGANLKDVHEQGILSMCLGGFHQQQCIPKLYSRNGVDPSTVFLCS